MPHRTGSGGELVVLVVLVVQNVLMVQGVPVLEGLGGRRVSHVNPSSDSSSGGAPVTMRRRSSSIRAITVVW